ncbi:MAG: hypothetical protein OEZ22_14865 [Spirochaetia bacterium]|nr:hypothetical protein [Spirochaetia bacterium]
MKNLFILNLLIIFLLNCGTGAIISKNDGQKIEGKILRNDKENMYIKTYSGEEPIKKSDITDIDHPGNGVLIGGSILSLYGILNISVGLPQCQEQGAAFCTGVFLPASIGIPMAIWGYFVWTDSVYAAESSSFDTSYLFIPNIKLANNNSYYGFHMISQF